MKAFALSCGDIEDCVTAKSMNAAIKKAVKRHMSWNEKCQKHGCCCPGKIALVYEADIEEGKRIYLSGDRFMEIAGLKQGGPK